MMNHYMLKSMKIAFWFLMPFLFISNSDIDPNMASNGKLEGFTHYANEPFEQLLKGKATFETNMGTTDQGAAYSSISLRFGNEGNNQEHIMGFLIKKMNSQKQLAIGEYGLSGHINGLLNNFDGVFGYADAKSLGGEPLFMKKGKLVITQIDEFNIYGYLDVVFMDNSNGELFVKGDFQARNLGGK